MWVINCQGGQDWLWIRECKFLHLFKNLKSSKAMVSMDANSGDFLF